MLRIARVMLRIARVALRTGTPCVATTVTATVTATLCVEVLCFAAIGAERRGDATRRQEGAVRCGALQ